LASRIGFPHVSGLGTCVTHRYQDVGDTPPSAGGVDHDGQQYRAVLEAQPWPTVTDVGALWGIPHRSSIETQRSTTWADNAYGWGMDLDDETSGKPGGNPNHAQTL
jgi:hypothetical protein